MSRDPRIDAYIAKAGEFARPILEHVRETVHATIPGLDEDMKWGRPHFVHKGKNLAGMAAFKAHCAVMIHGDGRQGGALEYGKVTSLDDLPDRDEFTAKLREARERIEKGGTAVPRPATRAPRAEIPVPQDFAAALGQNDAAKATWEGFAPSHRREYLEWITEAKRDETREKRIVQSLEWLAEGKKRNWKYESC